MSRSLFLLIMVRQCVTRPSNQSYAGGRGVGAELAPIVPGLGWRAPAGTVCDRVSRARAYGMV